MTNEENTAFFESIRAASEYTGEIIKPALRELGGLFADVCGNWRLQNRVRLILKTKRFLEEKNIRPEKLLPSVFIPLLEAAGDTDDPKLSEMFASLLATQLDPKTQDTVHPSFAKILGQLGPLDARLLELIDDYERSPEAERNYRQVVKPIHRKQITEKLQDQPESHMQLSIENIIRVGLLERAMAGGLWITEFGCNFTSACLDRAPRKPIRGNAVEAIEEGLDEHEGELEELKHKVKALDQIGRKIFDP